MTKIIKRNQQESKQYKSNLDINKKLEDLNILEIPVESYPLFQAIMEKEKFELHINLLNKEIKRLKIRSLTKEEF